MSICAANAQPPKRTHHVEITNFIFEPDNIMVKPGDSITWTNSDIAPHTATGTDGSWDTGLINKGESKTVIVDSQMNLNYLCLYHPSMKAKVSIDSD